MQPELEVRRYHSTALSQPQIVAVVQLLNEVWPREDRTLAQQIERFRAAVAAGASTATESSRPSLRHLVWDNAKLVAHAHTFERIVLADGRKISVMALSGVTVAPEYRGQGWGAAVVGDAFTRVDRGEFPVALFQTAVPAFYQRWGGRVVENQFVNRQNADDPEANPWFERWIMIYPGEYHWPQGIIDLNGPGY